MIKYYLNLSLAQKLMVSLLCVGILPMLLISILALNIASTNLNLQSNNQLESIREIKSSAIQRYFHDVEAQIVTLGSNPSTIAAMSELATGFRNIGSETTEEQLDAAQITASLQDYYEQEFGTRFYQENHGASANESQLLASLNEQVRLMQYFYISNNEHPLGQKLQLVRPEAAGAYHDTHAYYHPGFRNFLQKFGQYDIFLVDITTGDVVYTVFKELDFATSLLDGPYANTGLGKAFANAKTLAEGETVIEDYSLYLPSYNAPASFIATPLFDDGRAIGVLIFQLPLEPINAIMSERAGMGESGESYLVGADFLMRSDSFLDPAAHSVSASFRSPDKGLVTTEAVHQAFAGNAGNKVIEDYMGNTVLSSYAPVELGHFTWAIICEIDEAEAFAGISALKTWTAIFIAAGIALIVAFAWFNSSLLLKPILALSNCIQTVQKEGNFSHRLNNDFHDEIGMTSRAFNAFLADLATFFKSTDRVLTELGRGNSNERIDAEYPGQIGRMTAGINSAVSQVEKATNEVKRQAEEAKSSAKRAEQAADEVIIIKQALDNSSTCALIADAGFTVVYANDALIRLMKNSAPALRRDLPGFNAESIVGASIDMFYGNPGAQRSLLAGISNTHKETLNTAGLTFTVTSSPILDTKGKRLGTVIEWQDRTSEVGIEKEVDEIVTAVAAGDFSKKLRIDNKQGFILNLSNGLNKLTAATSEVITEVMSVFSALAKGDLTYRIERNLAGDFARIKHDANETIDKLNEVIEKIAFVSATIAQNSKEISMGISNLSSRTEEQAASLEQTSSSVRQLSTSVDENLRFVENGNRMAMGSCDYAKEGRNVVQSSVNAMSAIASSSGEISNIISVMNGIAFQTNLLALNAAVEAARAGEQGKGFAVVAGEVRQLAQRSANAAREINALINASLEKVQGGTLLVNSSGATLEKIVGEIQGVGTIMMEIMKSAQEQSEALSQVGRAISLMDEMTQQNAALVEEATAVSESMANQSSDMDELVSFFKRSKSTVAPYFARQGRG